MSSNETNEKYLSSEMHIKSKLNSLWSELQQNLPEINFDADDNDDVDLGFVNNLNKLDDNDFEQIERDFMNAEADDDDWHLIHHNDITDTNNRDIYSSNNVAKHMQLFNGNAEKELKSMKKMEESVASALNITKNIFEPVSSKLNMDLLNNLKIVNDEDDEEDDEIGDLEFLSSDERQFYEKRKASKLNDKEKNLMDKLHAMSLAFSNENDVLIKEQIVTKENSFSAIDMLERTLTGRSHYSANYPTELNGPPSGNFVETRKIDLRPKTAEKKDIVERVTYKKPVMMHKDSAFDESSSCSDSDSDSGDDNHSSLWIERYRRQKMLSAKANDKK